MKSVILIIAVVLLTSCGKPEVYEMNYMDLKSKSELLNEKYEEQKNEELKEVVENVDAEFYKGIYKKLGLNEAQQKAMELERQENKKEYGFLATEYHVSFRLEFLKDIFDDRGVKYSNLKEDILNDNIFDVTLELTNKYEETRTAKIKEFEKMWEDKKLEDIKIEELGFDKEDWDIFVKGSQRLIDLNDIDRLKGMKVGEIIEAQRMIEN